MGVLDVSVDEVEGLPAHTYISVRYGESRRQAPFRAGEVLSFALPGAAEKLPKAYTVDVFRKVASKQVSLAGIVAMGGAMRHENLVIPSLEIQGAPVTVSLSSAFAEEKTDTVEVNKKREVAVKARQYLEKHDVQAVLHEMFAQMLERMPGDPLAFMIDYLEQKREEAEDREPRNFADEPGLGEDPLPGFADGQSGEDLPDLAHHHSIAADTLRRDASIYNSFRSQQTSLGVTLAQCIKSGIDCPGHELVRVAGAFAGDGESYDLFAGLFDPVIAALHGGWAAGRAPLDRNPAKITNAQIDPTGRYAVFASMETRRNLQGLRFSTCCSKHERREVERVLGVALRKAEGALRGSYLPLRSSQSYAAKPGGMSAHQEERLRTVGMLFAEPDSRMRLSAGLGRHWPDARGIFLSETQGFCVWCNEEDHLRFFAKQGEADLKRLWVGLDQALTTVQETAKEEGYGFSVSKRLGYLTTCPSRLGSALRITVTLKIPLLAAAVDLPALGRSLDLACSQIEGSATHGGCLWQIMSSDCLGVSEVDLMNGMIEGCHLLVSLEQRLERGEAIYDAMPGLGDEAFPGFPADRCPARMPELSGNTSLMGVVLRETPALYAQLRTRKTNKGVTLAPCVKPGMDEVAGTTTTGAGIVAGDGSCYTMFKEIFDPVIRRLHAKTCEDVFEAGFHHPTDVRLSKLQDVDLGSVLAVRAELRRNFTGLRLAPCCSRQERQEVERLLIKSMLSLRGAFKGEYLPLPHSETYAPKPGGVSPAEQAELCEKGWLFAEPSAPSRLSAGLGREWPEARGSFLTEAQDLWVFCNEEDHVRIISRQEGRNLKGALARALDCAQQLEAELQREGSGYMRDGRLGYLTVDPKDIGSALRCTVTMRLQRLAARPDFFSICSKLDLQVAWRSGAWDLASGPSLGLSEVEVANGALQACARLAQLEKQLEQGGDIEAKVAELGRRSG